jgi:hypothetical protein
MSFLEEIKTSGLGADGQQAAWRVSLYQSLEADDYDYEHEHKTDDDTIYYTGRFWLRVVNVGRVRYLSLSFRRLSRRLLQ